MIGGHVLVLIESVFVNFWVVIGLPLVTVLALRWAIEFVLMLFDL